MLKLLIGIVLVALVATVGDSIWYELGVRHRMTAGVIHGAVLIMAVGGALGWPAGRFQVGLVVGVVSGIAGALVYYALAGAINSQVAMMMAWASVWLLLAIGEGRIIRQPRRPWVIAAGSGVIAAALSGVAFYLVSDKLWGHTTTHNYVTQFGYWLIAWAPGLIAIGRSQRSSNG
jgi:uncharacterized membrane protein (UPF0136 family)